MAAISRWDLIQGFKGLNAIKVFCTKRCKEGMRFIKTGAVKGIRHLRV
jgi:hypothetical protein